jgi:hypothetical protein
LIARQKKNGKSRIRKVLLIAEILIGGNKNIELAFCSRQQGAILDSAPSHFLRGTNVSMAQTFLYYPRRAFIEQPSCSIAQAGKSVFGKLQDLDRLLASNSRKVIEELI